MTGPRGGSLDFSIGFAAFITLWLAMICYTAIEIFGGCP